MTPRPANSRGAAAELLCRWLRTGDFPERLVDRVAEDHAFVMEVVYGVVRWHRLLQWIVNKFTRNRPGPQVVAYVYVGLYQLLYMDRVAPYAAANETVGAAKAAMGPAKANFVNAILQRFGRERASVLRRIDELPDGLRLSHADVLVARWTEALGRETMLSLAEWNNGRSRTVIRVSTARTNFAAYCAEMTRRDLSFAPHPYAPEQCLVCSAGIAVPHLPGFAEGHFYVQDPATMLAVERLDPQPGERLLDACAAPGGKAVYMAERMAGEGELIAMDLHKDRLPRLRSNVERMGVGGVVRLVHGDATAAVKALGDDAGQFDGILVDAPCTNTGVIQRRPDVRWRFSVERLKALVARQRAILDGVAPLLRPGGRLVYSTCSIEPEECAGQVQGWLAEHPDFVCAGEETLLPGARETDGAYVAVLRRN